MVSRLIVVNRSRELGSLIFFNPIGKFTAENASLHQSGLKLVDPNLLNLVYEFEILAIYHEDLEKRGGVWCGGVRETNVSQ